MKKQYYSFFSYFSGDERQQKLEKIKFYKKYSFLQTSLFQFLQKKQTNFLKERTTPKMCFQLRSEPIKIPGYFAKKANNVKRQKLYNMDTVLEKEQFFTYPAFYLKNDFNKSLTHNLFVNGKTSLLDKEDYFRGALKRNKSVDLSSKEWKSFNSSLTSIGLERELKKDQKTSLPFLFSSLNPEERMRKKQNFSFYVPNFFPHRKSFMQYWIFPFVGFVAIVYGNQKSGYSESFLNVPNINLTFNSLFMLKRQETHQPQKTQNPFLVTNTRKEPFYFSLIKEKPYVLSKKQQLQSDVFEFSNENLIKNQSGFSLPFVLNSKEETKQIPELQNREQKEKFNNTKSNKQISNVYNNTNLKNIYNKLVQLEKNEIEKGYDFYLNQTVNWLDSSFCSDLKPNDPICFGFPSTFKYSPISLSQQRSQPNGQSEKTESLLATHFQNKSISSFYWYWYKLNTNIKLTGSLSSLFNKKKQERNFLELPTKLYPFPDNCLLFNKRNSFSKQLNQSQINKKQNGLLNLPLNSYQKSCLLLENYLKQFNANQINNLNSLTKEQNNKFVYTQKADQFSELKYAEEIFQTVTKADNNNFPLLKDLYKLLQKNNSTFLPIPENQQNKDSKVARACSDLLNGNKDQKPIFIKNKTKFYNFFKNALCFKKSNYNTLRSQRNTNLVNEKQQCSLSLKTVTYELLLLKTIKKSSYLLKTTNQNGPNLSLINLVQAKMNNWLLSLNFQNNSDQFVSILKKDPQDLLKNKTNIKQKQQQNKLLLIDMVSNNIPVFAFKHPMLMSGFQNPNNKVKKLDSLLFIEKNNDKENVYLLSENPYFHLNNQKNTSLEFLVSKKQTNLSNVKSFYKQANLSEVNPHIENQKLFFEKNNKEDMKGHLSAFLKDFFSFRNQTFKTQINNKWLFFQNYSSKWHKNQILADAFSLNENLYLKTKPVSFVSYVKPSLDGKKRTNLFSFYKTNLDSTFSSLNTKFVLKVLNSQTSANQNNSIKSLKKHLKLVKKSSRPGEQSFKLRLIPSLYSLFDKKFLFQSAFSVDLLKSSKNSNYFNVSVQKPKNVDTRKPEKIFRTYLSCKYSEPHNQLFLDFSNPIFNKYKLNDVKAFKTNRLKALKTRALKLKIGFFENQSHLAGFVKLNPIKNNELFLTSLNKKTKLNKKYLPQLDSLRLNSANTTKIRLSPNTLLKRIGFLFLSLPQKNQHIVSGTKNIRDKQNVYLRIKNHDGFVLTQKSNRFPYVKNMTSLLEPTKTKTSLFSMTEENEKGSQKELQKIKTNKLSNEMLVHLEKQKYQQKKNRKRKLNKEKRRKRKRSYPRPIWLRFQLYNKFLKVRHSINKADNYIISPFLNRFSLQDSSLLKGANMQSNASVVFKKSLKLQNKNKRLPKNQLINTWLLYFGRSSNVQHQKIKNKISRNNKQSWGSLPSNIVANQRNLEKTAIKQNIISQFSPIFAQHDFYKISNTIMIDFQKLCWKSYWLRSNLTPYIQRIENHMKQMKESQKNWVLTQTLNTFVSSLLGFNVYNINNFYTHSLLPVDLDSNLNLRGYKYGELSPYLNMKTSFDTKNFVSSFSAFQQAQQKSEYNRILYERISDIIKNVKTNSNLNGQIHAKSFKRGRRKSEKTYSPSFWTRLGEPFSMVAGSDNSHFSIKPYSDLPTLRVLWALNKTNLFSFKDLNQTKSLWASLKIKQQQKANKTKKFVSQSIRKLFSSSASLKMSPNKKHVNTFSLLSEQHKTKRAQQKIRYSGFVVKYYESYLREFKSNLKSSSFSKQHWSQNSESYPFFYRPESLSSFESNQQPSLSLQSRNKSRGEKETKSPFKTVVLSPIPESLQNVSSVRSRTQNQQTSASKKHPKRAVNYWWNRLYNSLMSFSYNSQMEDFCFIQSLTDKNPEFFSVNNTTPSTSLFLKNEATSFFWALTILFHVCSLFSLIRIPEVRSLAKFYLLIIYKISNSYLIVLYKIYDVLQNYKRQISLLGNHIAKFSFNQSFTLNKNKAFNEAIKTSSASSNSQFWFSSAQSRQNQNKNEFKQSLFSRTSPKTLYVDSFLKYTLTELIVAEKSNLLDQSGNLNQNVENNRTEKRLKQQKNISRSILAKEQSGHVSELTYRLPRLALITETFGTKTENLLEFNKKYLPTEIFWSLLTFVNKYSLNLIAPYSKRIFYSKQNQHYLRTVGSNQKWLTTIDKQNERFSILTLTFKSAVSLSSTGASLLTNNDFKKLNFKQKIKETKTSTKKNVVHSSTTTSYAKGHSKEQQNPMAGDLVTPSSTMIISCRKIEEPIYENSTFLSLVFLKFSSIFLYTTFSLARLGESAFYSGLNVSYTFLLKVVDILESFMLIIYKFLEKPAELMIEWIASLFLLEWSSDITTFVPETLDIYTWNSFKKFSRGTSLIFLQNTLGLNKTTAAFGLLGGTILVQRRLWCFFEILLDSLTAPDIDLILRQKKGVIFWDIWAEILIGAAEKYNINIPSLTTLKEEQELLLEKLLVDENWDWYQTSTIEMTPLVELIQTQQTQSLSNVLSQTWQNARTPNLAKGLDQKMYLRLKANPNNFETFFRSLNKKPNVAGNTLNGSDRVESSYSVMQYKSKTNVNTKFKLISEEVLNSKTFNKFRSLPERKQKTDTNEIWRRWATNQYFTWKGKDIDLFVDIHPPKSFRHVNFLPYYEPAQQILGSLVCQIYSGLFSKQVSKNILIVGAPGTGKSLLIQALAGETESVIITDNASRYALVQGGVAVGMKLLRDVFDAIALHTPCIFLMEEIHVIGERRPMLISEDENAKAAEPSFGVETQEVHEKNQLIYQLSVHSIAHYRQPYKGDFSLLIPTNHFCLDLFCGVSPPKTRKLGITPKNPLPIETIEAQMKQQNNLKTNVESADSNLLSTQKDGANRKVSQLQLTREQHFAPPATSPFTILILKENKKLKPRKIVAEMPWSGFSWDQIMLISKVNYSVRVKVAMLADIAISNLAVKLDMITDLLVIIDSVRSNRGFVVFATTHLPSILDPALRRPGRLDETIYLPLLPSLITRWEMFKTNLSSFTSTVDFLDYAILAQNLSLQAKDETLLFNLISKTKLLLLNTSIRDKSLLKARLKNPLVGFKQKNHIPLLLNAKDLTFQSSLPLTKSLSEENSFVQSEIRNKTKMKKTDRKTLKEFPIYSIAQALKTVFHAELVDPFKINKRVQKLSNLEKIRKRYLGNNLEKNLSHSFQSKSAQTPKKQALFTFLKRMEGSPVIPTGPSSLTAFTYFQIGKFLIHSQFVSDQTSYGLVVAVSQQMVFANLENSSENVFRDLYAPNLDIQNTLSKFFAGKIAEFFLFNSSKTRTIVPSHFRNTTLSTNNNRNSINGLSTQQTNEWWNSLQTPEYRGLMNLVGVDHLWHSATSFLFSLLQKRYLYNKNLLVSRMLYFDDISTLKEPPSPPSSSILMPAKRYENLRRTERDFQQKANLSIHEKIQLHSKQRLMRKLYNQPIKEHFRSETVPNRLTVFNQSFKELGYLERFVRKPTSVNAHYKNKYLTRHKFQLVNQWWNGQLAEHNVEATFLSDVDWRSMFVKSNNLNLSEETDGDLIIDFPDADQHYNPRRRRWFLHSSYWGYWSSFEKTLQYEIYYHFTIQCFNKTFNYLESQREILDFFAYAFLKKGSLKEIDLVTLLSRFYMQANSTLLSHHSSKINKNK